jgi:phosphohistidine phosphatase
VRWERLTCGPRCYIPGPVKTLLLMRHAKSSWQDSDLADHERPLNARGQRAAPWMGQWLRGRGIRLDQIVTSSAVRAADTAKAIAEELDYAGPVVVSPGLYMADVARILGVISEAEPSTDALLILGHNPGISEVASLLTGAELDMPTAGLAWIELDLEQFRDIHEKTRGRLVTFERPPKEDKPQKGGKKGKS